MRACERQAQWQSHFSRPSHLQPTLTFRPLSDPFVQEVKRCTSATRRGGWTAKLAARHASAGTSEVPVASRALAATNESTVVSALSMAFAHQSFYCTPWLETTDKYFKQMRVTKEGTIACDTLTISWSKNTAPDECLLPVSLSELFPQCSRLPHDRREEDTRQRRSLLLISTLSTHISPIQFLLPLWKFFFLRSVPILRKCHVDINSTGLIECNEWGKRGKKEEVEQKKSHLTKIVQFITIFFSMPYILLNTWQYHSTSYRQRYLKCRQTR